MTDDPAYYKADVRGLNPGDATTRKLDPLDNREYTYATTRLDIVRDIALLRADLAAYQVALSEPIEADPDAAHYNIFDTYVRAPSGAVVDVVGD